MDVEVIKQNGPGLRFDDAVGRLGFMGRYFTALPGEIRARAQEVRLRVGRPASVSLPENDFFVTKTGAVTSDPADETLLVPQKREIEEVFRLLCSSSVYSHQQEIKNGYLVLRGGHRAGICGTAVLQDGRVENLRDISSIALRVAREVKGAADDVLRAVVRGGQISGTLIFGPPGCGKTTVLRDLARQLSYGAPLERRARVAVVDERGEIAATCLGEPQNDLGPCCDVLNGYPKGEGILQAVRALAPDVVLCDEIGGADDARAVQETLNAGVAVIATAHAGSMEELAARPQIAAMIQSLAFRSAVLLKDRRTPGAVRSVYTLDDTGKRGVLAHAL